MCIRDRSESDPVEVVLNDLGPVALPRIGKKERFSKPCPRHRQAGHRAGPHQYLSKPFHCGCCVGTCELCDPAKPQWSPCPRHPPPGRFTCELCCPALSATSGGRRSQWSLTSGTFFHTRCARSPSSSPTTDSDLAFGADPFGDGAASEDLPQPESQPDSKGEVPQTPWPCARCNLEPRDTVWRPLDGATPFDTEERICGVCWDAVRHGGVDLGVCWCDPYW